MELALPTVTAIGTGRYQFTGSIQNTVDAPRVREMVALVVQFDSLGNLVAFVYSALAQVTLGDDVIALSQLSGAFNP